MDADLLTESLRESYYYEYNRSKVTGRYKFAGDYYLSNMLYAKVLRAGVPHALIEYIDVSDAYKVPGVRTVATYRDVPGLNAFGYFKPNQPVFCRDKVRYVGDAVAAVAAETEEAALEAIRSIRVRYVRLDGVFTIEDALKEETKVHEEGNVAHSVSYERGSYAGAPGEEFSDKYEIGSVKQMYIEPESALAWVENGILHIVTTTQSPDHDVQQISQSLNVPPERIKLIYPDPGGAFGGKEEIHGQIIAGLLALKTGRPVKLTFTREESNISTTRRISMDIEVRAKVTNDMKIQGLFMKVLAEAGAYLSHAPIVLEVAGSHAPGPYSIPNVRFEGLLVYTNYPPVGGMRGYGASEVNFALERHLDRIAREKGWDPIEFRYVNALKEGEPYGTGVVPLSHSTLRETLEMAKSSALLNPESKKSDLPFVKVGVGIASGMKSTSYGLFGDSAQVELVLSRGSLKALFTTPDMGTGIRFGVATVLSRALNLPDRYIQILNDSSANPRSGTSNASRVLFMIGNAALDAARKLMIEVKERYGTEDLSSIINSINEEIRVVGKYELPSVKGGVYRKSDIIFSFITALARVEVNVLTGFIRVSDIEMYTEAGKIIFPKGYFGQLEGGAIMSLGYALYEDLKLKGGEVQARNFTTYILPVAKDVPKIRIYPIEVPDPNGPYGAKGIGELPLMAVAPAIVNAIVDATGKEIRGLPINRETILA
ncbi:MAG: xanthine dehydrogenase family protein molybdopterin-binding subunit [Nitrososphaeria archaeon]